MRRMSVKISAVSFKKNPPAGRIFGCGYVDRVSAPRA